MLKNQIIRIAKAAVAQTSRQTVLRAQLQTPQFIRPSSRVSYFSTTSTTLAKKKEKKSGNKKGKNEKEDPEEEVEVIDSKKMLSDLEKNFQTTSELFNKKAAEIKMGQANPKIFDNLSINIEKRDYKFTELAATSLQGKNLTVTVFDPNNSKRIISAILAADLNLNPEVDPKNEQLLKIKLPNTSTKEMKLKQSKQLKTSLNYLATDNANSHSLSSLRAKVVKDLKKAGGSKDVLKKLNADVDKLYKKYIDKMNDSHKTIEKSFK